ncbi:helix-hairpin-helix domain-containing protein [Jeotgalibaca sp. A122]|uniref:helix-hairpin-helix domain-containing protein n=1 Tax=Jeotgalibaca sp. A122 TaxID=3457322 RepID=UPI003FD22AA9
MEKYKKWRVLILASIGLIQLIVIIFIILSSNTKETEEPPNSWLMESQVEVMSETSSELEPIFWVVDVKGAVVKPGIYEVAKNMRVQDAIDLAGGILPDAETRHLNFAQHLMDQMLIYVPLKGEESETEPADSIQIPGSETTDNEKININTADEMALQTLPGIGGKKAQQIISYRSENGSFTTIEDIMNVSGIGQKTFDSFKELISVKN